MENIQKQMMLTKIAKLSDYLDRRGLREESMQCDHLLMALANEDTSWTQNVRNWMQDQGKNMQRGSNLEGREQMQQVENMPKETAPRSVIKLQSKGLTMYPLTVKQLNNAIKDYGLNLVEVIRSIVSSVDPTGKTYNPASFTLNDAVKLAVDKGLLKDSWF